jgi:signal transduction histidine kinase
MKHFRVSITTKLLGLFLAVGILTLLIVGFYSFYSTKRAIVMRTMDQLISVRATKKQQVEYFVKEKIKNLENLADDKILPALSGTLIPDQLSRINQENEIARLRQGFISYGFTHLYLLRPDIKQVLAIDSASSGLSFLSSSLVKAIREISSRIESSEKVAVSDLFFKSSDDTLPVCLIGRELFSEKGKPAGTIFLEIPSSAINRIMLQDNSRIGLGNSGEAYIVGHDHLMRSSSRFIRNSVLRIPVRSESAIQALEGENGAGITDDYRGIRVFSAFEPLEIKGLKWVVLAEIDYDEAMSTVNSLRNDIVLVSLIISLFILGISQLISKMIAQPVFRLKNAAARLGKGDFGNKVKIRTGDELESLAETFNTMSDQLKEEREKRIRALYDGQEMERRRISRELHDGLGQKLVGAKLKIENCNEEDSSCLALTMKDTKSGLLEIIDELRRISNDLIPASLDELGLVTALRNLAAEVSSASGVETEFDAEIQTKPAGFRAVYLFRIAQEAVQNILKHARATFISIQLLETRDSIILIIEDNGTGYDLEQAPKGNGLANMQERTTLAGGSLSVESAPGKGTTVRVKIPKTHEPED